MVVFMWEMKTNHKFVSQVNWFNLFRICFSQTSHRFQYYVLNQYYVCMQFSHFYGLYCTIRVLQLLKRCEARSGISSSRLSFVGTRHYHRYPVECVCKYFSSVCLPNFQRTFAPFFFLLSRQKPVKLSLVLDPFMHCDSGRVGVCPPSP